MSRSHEHVEGLLNQRGDTASLGEGFRDRVAQGISGEAPGTLPVGAAVMPAAVKGVIGFGVVGAASAMIWIAATAGPSIPEPQIVGNDGNTMVENELATQGASAVDALRSLRTGLSKEAEGKADLFSEGRKILASAVRVGEAFVSIFPRDWTDLIWKPGPRQSSAPTASPAAPAPSPATQNPQG